METGTIKKLISDKGFGFIARDGQEDLFFHAKELQDGLVFEELSEGDTVNFEITEGPKGLNATNVAKA